MKTVMCRTLKSDDFVPPDFSYVIEARDWALYRDGPWGKWNEEAVMRRTERETETRRERIGSVLIIDDPFYFSWRVDVWMKQRDHGTHKLG